MKLEVKINKWRENFMLEVLLLYLIILGRILTFSNWIAMVALANNAIVSSSGISLIGYRLMLTWLNPS